MTRRLKFLLLLAVVLLLAGVALDAMDVPDCDCQIGSDDTSTTTCAAPALFCNVHESWWRCGDNFIPWLSDNTCNGLRRLKENN